MRIKISVRGLGDIDVNPGFIGNVRFYEEAELIDRLVEVLRKRDESDFVDRDSENHPGLAGNRFFYRGLVKEEGEKEY